MQSPPKPGAGTSLTSSWHLGLSFCCNPPVFEPRIPVASRDQGPWNSVQSTDGAHRRAQTSGAVLGHWSLWPGPSGRVNRPQQDRERNSLSFLAQVLSFLSSWLFSLRRSVSQDLHESRIILRYATSTPQAESLQSRGLAGRNG